MKKKDKSIDLSLYLIDPILIFFVLSEKKSSNNGSMESFASESHSSLRNSLVFNKKKLKNGEKDLLFFTTLQILYRGLNGGKTFQEFKFSKRITAKKQSKIFNLSVIDQKDRVEFIFLKEYINLGFNHLSNNRNELLNQPKEKIISLLLINLSLLDEIELHL